MDFSCLAYFDYMRVSEIARPYSHVEVKIHITLTFYAWFHNVAMILCGILTKCFCDDCVHIRDFFQLMMRPQAMNSAMTEATAVTIMATAPTTLQLIGLRRCGLLLR